jgi:hypothetical protein
VQTQKDHVDAYAFLMGRMTSALVTGDANGVEVPARRAWTGLVTGAALAVLIAAGFVVFGLIVPAHPAGANCDPAHLNPARVAIRGGGCPATAGGQQGGQR